MALLPIGPSQRVERDISEARSTTDASRYLIEYLATYGARDIDVAELANNALAIDERDE